MRTEVHWIGGFPAVRLAVMPRPRGGDWLEAEGCAAVGIQFVSLPISDRGVPACRQGVGRSALVAACILAALGEPVDAGFERIAKARGRPVPDTPEQRKWVRVFAETHLAVRRGGF